MNVEKRDFDKEAARWDEHPARVKLAADIASAILKQIMLKPDMDVLDFGCGTGLLTLRMAPMVKSITGVDSSLGMINVLREKATKQRQTNVRVVQLDPDLGKRFPDIGDHPYKMPCPAVRQVITRHGGDDRVADRHRHYLRCNARALPGIKGRRRAMVHGAETAVARAVISHDEKCRGSRAEAFREIGTPR